MITGFHFHQQLYKATHNRSYELVVSLIQFRMYIASYYEITQIIEKNFIFELN